MMILYAQNFKIKYLNHDLIKINNLNICFKCTVCNVILYSVYSKIAGKLIFYEPLPGPLSEFKYNCNEYIIKNIIE